jgi:hypothetical protein
MLITAACAGNLPLVPIPTPSPASSAAAVSPVAGFGERSPAPSPSASPSASPSPQPQTPAYGVLVDVLSSPTYYMASLVSADGLVWASLRNAKRTPIANQVGHAIPLPYVSTSLTSMYYLDGDSTLKALSLADGSQRTVTTLTVTGGQEAAFSVSPDDQRIAVSVLDYTGPTVRLTLYTDLLAGGHRKVIFASTSNWVWPVAWHSGLLVLAHAYGPYAEDLTKAAPDIENPYGAISYHLVDPSNAYRKVLMGACTVSGPLSPAGSGCIQGGAIDWTGNDAGPWSTTDWGQRSSAAALSPDGQWVAAADPNNPDHMAIWRHDGSIGNYATASGNLHDWAGWIDNENLIVGSYFNGTWVPTVENVIRGGYVHSIAAQGFYAARLPTDIT